MKTRIEVSSKQEGELLQLALNDPPTRAFNLVVAVLRSLESDRARRRVMAFVKDYFEEQDSQAVSLNPPTEAKTNGSGEQATGS